MAKAAIATFGKTLVTCPNCKSEKPKEIVSRKNKLGLLGRIIVICTAGIAWLLISPFRPKVILVA